MVVDPLKHLVVPDHHLGKAEQLDEQYAAPEQEICLSVARFLCLFFSLSLSISFYVSE